MSEAAEIDGGWEVQVRAARVEELLGRSQEALDRLARAHADMEDVTFHNVRFRAHINLGLPGGEAWTAGGRCGVVSGRRGFLRRVDESGMSITTLEKMHAPGM